MRVTRIARKKEANVFCVTLVPSSGVSAVVSRDPLSLSDEWIGGVNRFITTRLGKIEKKLTPFVRYAPTRIRVTTPKILAQHVVA